MEENSKSEDRVMVTYPEDQATKDWLDENTGKTKMSAFIRSAVAEKIRRQKKLCMECGEVKVNGNNVFCSKCSKK